MLRKLYWVLRRVPFDSGQTRIHFDYDYYLYVSFDSDREFDPHFEIDFNSDVDSDSVSELDLALIMLAILHRN